MIIIKRKIVKSNEINVSDRKVKRENKDDRSFSSIDLIGYSESARTVSSYTYMTITCPVDSWHSDYLNQFTENGWRATGWNLSKLGVEKVDVENWERRMEMNDLHLIYIIYKLYDTMNRSLRKLCSIPLIQICQKLWDKLQAIVQCVHHFCLIINSSSLPSIPMI